MISPIRLIVAAVWSCTFFIFAIVLLNALFGGVFLDTDHIPDTLLILGASWRSYQGLVPAVDFGYFYGGVLEDGIAKTMRIFGPGVFSFDYFSLFLTVGFWGAIIVALKNRMSALGLASLVLVVTVLMLTRQPLEYGFAVSKIVSTHSFLYNRVGLAAVMIAGLFVALPSTDRRAERLGGAVIGLVVCFAALVKPTFAILVPAAIGGLVIQRRWDAIAGALLGVVGLVLLVDPMLERWRGALEYSFAQVGGDRAAGLDYLLVKAVRGPFVQPLATLLALVSVGYILVRGSSVSAVLGMLLVAVAGIGMTATMGGHIGQVVLPITIMIVLAVAELAGIDALDYHRPLQFLAVSMVAALAVPHALNLLGATVTSRGKQAQMRIAAGPFAHYFAVPLDDKTGTSEDGYEMLADGIAALRAMGDPSEWGIVADQGITFEYALLAKPVPGYPLWQRRTAPEFAANRPLAREVDVVMLGRNDYAISLRSVLIEKMQQDFAFCRQSTHWDIYVRRSRNITGCI